MARWQLPDDTEAAALARDLVRSELPLASSKDLNAAVLLTDELVANAVRHGASPIFLEVDVHPRQVRVAVSDGSGAPIEVRDDPGGRHSSGRGLYLVDTLSTRWGVDGAVPGKRVWFELDLD
jgi:anti-sigma regulatory factor (Ser/Thr protein kinase)